MSKFSDAPKVSKRVTTSFFLDRTDVELLREMVQNEAKNNPMAEVNFSSFVRGLIRAEHAKRKAGSA